MTHYAVVTAGDSPEDAEAWGPFVSLRRAEQFAERYDEAAIRPYMPVVIELWPVRDGWRQIKDEEEQDR